MTSRKIIVLFFLLLGLLACKKDPCITDYETFTDDEKSWLVYNIGDTLIYQSSSGDKDTFVVFEYDIRNREEIDPRGSLTPRCYYPITGTYKMTNTDSTMSAELYIVRDKTLETYFHKLPAIADFRTNLKTMTPLDKLTIDSVDFSDVYVVKRDQFQVGIKTIVNAIKFNKTNGFIQYEMADGTLWTLSKVIRK